MSTLERAIALAAVAHAGQIDKAGNPYILHPLRVMLNVRVDAARMDAARIAAVLHDVVEDTPVTPAQLRELGFSDTVITAVAALTKHPGEDDYLVHVAVGSSEELRDLVLEHINVHPMVRHTETQLVFEEIAGSGITPRDVTGR